MIRVTLPVSPGNYRNDVQRRGEMFLAVNPTPTGRDWDGHEYWREIHQYLYDSLNGICAYCASWMPRSGSIGSQDSSSVDHFIPKSVDPRGAYEWSNFRLCRARLNNRKSNYLDVVDPCEIQDGWFTIEFTTFLLKPASHLPSWTSQYIKLTIDRLELNSDVDYVNERISVIRRYSIGEITLDFIKRRFPFIAEQIQVQNFDVNFKAALIRVFTKIPSKN